VRGEGGFMTQRNRENRWQLKTAPYERPLVLVVLAEEAKPAQTVEHLFSLKDYIKNNSFGVYPSLTN